MNGTIEKVVIVGGGTAGWLAACSLAAARPGLDVTLVEAPDIPTIGVGEGTWPTLRATLAAISLDEAGFLTACDASFKKGSRFDGWVDGGADDRYRSGERRGGQACVSTCNCRWSTYHSKKTTQYTP